MTKYILHGGYTRDKNELNNSFFEEITKGLEGEIKILLVYFASEKTEYEQKRKKEEENFLSNSENKNLVFEIANENDLIDQIKKSDIIYIRGGITFKLLDVLKKYPTFSDVIKDKVIVGSSAGAYVLSKYFYHRQEPVGVFKGLGILPISIHCHYKGDATIVGELESKGLEVILLKDYEHRVINL